MTASCDIRVSIDVGCHSHSVAIGLASGDALDEFELTHRPEGFALFFERVDGCQRRYGGEVSVAMEGYNGWARPLDSLVRSHGYRLFNINNLKLKQASQKSHADLWALRLLHTQRIVLRAESRIPCPAKQNDERTKIRRLESGSSPANFNKANTDKRVY